MIQTSKVEFLNYGTCLRLTNGAVEALVTLDVGPRIISFSFPGGENILNTEKDAFGVKQDEAFDRHFYPGAAWQNFGGHRLWISPEAYPDTYYPDCKPVAYRVTDTGAVFTPAPQVENGVAMEMELVLDETRPVMQVRHRVTNISGAERKFAVWALSVAAQGGVEIIPLNTVDTGLLHNRTITVWPYTDLRDERIYFGHAFATVQQKPIDRALKLGFDNRSGTAYYVLGETVFRKQYEAHHPDGVYPDGGVSFETYSCALFTEIETLGEYRTVAPGATAQHSECWTLFRKPCDFDPKDDASLTHFVASLA